MYVILNNLKNKLFYARRSTIECACSKSQIKQKKKVNVEYNCAKANKALIQKVKQILLHKFVMTGEKNWKNKFKVFDLVNSFINLTFFNTKQ